MNNLQIFEYGAKEIRTVVIDNEVWFVAKDICDVLDIKNPTQAVDRLDSDERAMSDIGLKGDVNIVNEMGLYNLILRSDKPEAKPFKRWVTHEVLPSIRKTGAYIVPNMIDSKFLFQIALQLEEKEKKIAELTPKAEFFDAVANSRDAIDIGNAAKVLNMGIGRNRLFEILRAKGILMDNNIPYQAYIDRGYFRTIEQKYAKPDGSTHISIKTLVYQKGLAYIRKLCAQNKLIIVE